MKHERNDQSSTIRPLAAGHLKVVAASGTEDRQARRSAKEGRIYRNRKITLGAIGGAILLAAAAGGGRALLHDIDQGARDAYNNRTEAVGNAFAHPTGDITGQPSSAEAAHTVQANEAHNAAVEANKAAQAAQREELPH